MTELRRRLRYHQARWRVADRHPIGSQPIAPRPDGKPARPVGSHLPLDYAKASGADFLNGNALAPPGPEPRSRSTPELRPPVAVG